MKTKRILGLILSAAVLLCGCEKEKAPATISLDAAEIEVSMQGGTATVTVNSNYPWEARTEADWISFNPTKGDASGATVVNITVLPNEGTNRIGAVTFYGNNSRLCSAPVNIKQPGPKGEAGVAEQITVAEFIQRADGNTKYRLEGRISNIANASFFGFDLNDGTGTLSIAFPTNFEDYVNELVAGGVAVVEGTYQFYESKQTHQMANGKIIAFTAPEGPEFGPAAGSGTKTDPYNVAKAQQLASALSSSGKIENVYVKGKVSSVSEVNIPNGNATYYIEDEGYYGTFYVYRGKFLGGASFTSADQLKAGDEVIVFGTLVNYNGKTTEFTTGNRIYSLNGTTADGPAPPSNIVDVTVAEFLAKPVNNTDWYRLKGTVSGSINTTYGNFDVKDATGTVYFYGASNIAEFKSKLVSGATITVVGNRGVYNDKDEVVNGYIESIEEGQDVPATPVASVAELIATADDTNIEIENVKVAAVTKQGYMAFDGQHAIYVYTKDAPTVSVGDVVKFSGTKTTYYGLPEVTDPKTTKSGTAEITYPTPVDITANFDSYTANEAIYVKYSATIAIDGNYTNFMAPGATLKGSLTGGISYEGLNSGDQVVVYGFYNGVNTTSKLLNVVAVKVENTTTGQTIEYKSAGGSGGGGGGGGASGGTITVDGNVHTADFSAQGYANAEDFSAIANDVVTISASKGSGSNGPKYYNTGTALRLYAGNTLSVSAAKQITKIEFTFSSGEGNNEISADGGSYAEGTWTGTASSVKFTIGGSSGHRRIKVIKVTVAD